MPVRDVSDPEDGRRKRRDDADQAAMADDEGLALRCGNAGLAERTCRSIIASGPKSC
jgi:hypothetical protein